MWYSNMLLCIYTYILHMCALKDLISMKIRVYIHSQERREVGLQKGLEITGVPAHGLCYSFLYAYIMGV